MDRTAVRDANGDGTADLLIGSGEGSIPEVRIYLGSEVATSGQGEPDLHERLALFEGRIPSAGVFIG